MKYSRLILNLCSTCLSKPISPQHIQNRTNVIGYPICALTLIYKIFQPYPLDCRTYGGADNVKNDLRLPSQKEECRPSYC